MNKSNTLRVGVLLLILGVVSAKVAALGIDSPGYMDSDYYYAMGVQWANGQGREEPFLWNYLSDPEAIPTPSHMYWSPFTAMIIGVVLRLVGEHFWLAQAPFVLFTALLPYLVWRLALKLGVGDREALFAGLFALAPGYFLPYFVTTDAFSLYAILGLVLMILLLHQNEDSSLWSWFLIGLVCGLAHLTRADGFLFLIIPAVFIFRAIPRQGQSMGLVVGGYLLVMVPWFLLQASASTTDFLSGSGKALWLLSYDETFQYPADILTFKRWWGSGFVAILQSRVSTFAIVLQRVIAENGLIFLTPFMILGIIRKWGQPLVQAIIAYLLALVLVMVLIFPFAGARGGWFHSSSAAMPLLWILASIGLTASLNWVGERRGWTQNAGRVFRAAAVILALSLTWGLYSLRVVGVGSQSNPWNAASERYASVSELIQSRDPSPGVIAINNPPGFYHVSRLPSVVLPHGGIDALEGVVSRYDVTWVVIDENYPAGLEVLYLQTDIPAWLELETSKELLGSKLSLYRVIEVDS